MGKKIVFFDIDGTVWNWKFEIPESTKKAIGMLHENGHLAYICSGRAKGNLRADSLKELGFDGVVAACGAYVEMNGEIVYEKKVPRDVVKLTADTVSKCRLPSVLEGSEKHWISDEGFDNDDFVATMRKVLKEDAVDFHGYLEGMDINKFAADILRCSDYKTVKETLSFYYDFIEHGITPDFDEKTGEGPNEVIGVIEAVPHGMSKAHGVEMVCERLGIQKDDTYAIGDSVNDIDMLKSVAHSICMGNGAPAAKAVSSYVTTDIEENGVFNALKHYGLV